MRARELGFAVQPVRELLGRKMAERVGLLLQAEIETQSGQATNDCKGEDARCKHGNDQPHCYRRQKLQHLALGSEQIVSWSSAFARGLYAPMSHAAAGRVVKLNETLVSTKKSPVNFSVRNPKKSGKFVDGYPRIAKCIGCDRFC